MHRCHACPNPLCDSCQACNKRFSSRWGTALDRLHATAWDVGRVLLAVHLGLSMADVQQRLGHSDTPVRLWLSRAGAHAGKVHARFFRHWRMGHLPCDELDTTLRDPSHDLWVWVALDPQTTLIPALRIGPRTQDMAHALVHAVIQVLAPGGVPVCTRDGLHLYFDALSAHLGAWLTDPATGKPRWPVAAGRLYGQVIQAYRRRKSFQVERRMQLGQREDLPTALQR